MIGRTAHLRKQGFTLVELLIVVIILSILAAIVVPQFAGSASDAKNAALDANLSALRSATELYYQQHSAYPSANASTANAANSKEAFTDQLTLYSDATGKTANAYNSATFKYGPYLKKGIPVEPISNSAAVEIVFAGTLGAVATGAATGGWKFDNKTGQLIANSSDNNLDKR